MNKQTIVLGGGCFWCTEAVFQMLKGIISVMPGYAGGIKPNPTYNDVCNGNTGHAEVIQVEYDAEIISLDDVLAVFFGSHDPTQMNRQGNDIGTQYRSVIFYTTEEQKIASEKFIKDINDSSDLGNPIVTEVKLLDKFYEAEEYHKNYYKNNPEQGYCQVIINPKLAKVKEKFVRLLNKN